MTGTWPVQSATASPSSSSPPSAPIGHTSALLSCLSAAELRDLDSEGRCVLTDHGAFLLFNVYVPNAGEERNEFKLRYLELLSLRVRQCQAEGREVVVVGDLNIAATRLDHCQPEPFVLADGSKVPFEESPSRRWWRNNVTDTLGAAAIGCVDVPPAESDQQPRLVDVLRAEFPGQRAAYRYYTPITTRACTSLSSNSNHVLTAPSLSFCSCWNTLTGARAGNYGSRIDYILASLNVAAACHSSRILAHVQGSDHCPVQCSIDVQRLAGWTVGTVPPALCSQWWPELSGQQKKLSSFFTKLDPASTQQHTQQQQQQRAESEPELVAGKVAAAAATAPAGRSTPGNAQQPKRLADDSLKPHSRKRRKGVADTAPPPLGSASLLSYFAAPTRADSARSASR